jgi:hypothetical protein
MRRNEKIAHVAVQAAVREIAAKVPGASTALDIVQAVFKNCTDRRAQELFASIGERIGTEDWDAAAKTLEKNIGKPWFDETIDTGFRNIIECITPEARRCIGFLVAEYLVKERKPDATFRKVGWLLRESDAEALHTFLEICEIYVELIDRAGAGLRVLVRTTRRSKEPVLFWLAVLKDDSTTLGRCIAEPANLEENVRALVAHRIANYWTGLSSHTFEGDPVIKFNPTDDDVLRLLGSCLRAWDQQKTHVSSTP